MTTVYNADADMMGSWDGPMGPLLTARSGQASIARTASVERCKTSTRGISAKTPAVRKIHHHPLATSTHKLVVASPAMNRRSCQKLGPFTRVVSGSASQRGPLITRTASIARTGSGVTSFARTSSDAQTDSAKGTLGEILAIIRGGPPTLAREESGEKAHETPMRQRPTPTPLRERPTEFSRVPSHSYFTRTQSAVMGSFEGHMENLLRTA